MYASRLSQLQACTERHGNVRSNTEKHPRIDRFVGACVKEIVARAKQRSGCVLQDEGVGTTERRALVVDDLSFRGLVNGFFLLAFRACARCRGYITFFDVPLIDRY